MRNERKNKRKIKIFEKYSILLIIAILFMGIAYAKITNIELVITGKVDATMQEGVFISDITVASASGVDSNEIKYYRGTTLSSTVELSASTTSSLIYEISLYNNSGEDYYFTGVTYDPAAYDNTNISYELSGITPYITVIEPRETPLSFTIEFKYAKKYTPSTSEILNSMLNFNFSNEMIEFKVANTAYKAQKGATWEQFINSKYNTYGLKITDGKVYTTDGKQIYLLDKEVISTDVIKEGKTYNYKPELTLDKESIEVGTTTTESLTATLKNVPESEAENIKWTSSNTEVAEVVGNGNTATVTIKAGGTAEITVSYGTISATCTVTVTVTKKMPKAEVDIITQENSTIDGQEYSSINPIIPAGFMPINTNTSNWNAADLAAEVKKGLVISDGTSEFVWIPVEEISEMAKLTSGEDANGRTNYEGVLYNFTSTGATVKTGYGQSTTSFREPANLTLSGYEDSEERFTTITWSETLYQESFNKMVESVAEYKGFYVGRYETSLSSSGTAQSKAGEKSITAADTSSKLWWGLYEKATTYSTTGVISEMIWGSQYDAMLRWMQGNSIDVTSATPTDTSRGVAASKNTTRVTGSADSNDILNNIYDTLGNSYEWTQEADLTDIRVGRGGNYGNSDSPSRRDVRSPAYTSIAGGSRLTLYIEM